MADKKYAVITGGSSGLGFAIAGNLAKKGYTPVLIARRRNRLDEAVEALKKAGFDAYGFAGNIADPAEMSNIAELVRKELGSVDFLVLNAGVVTVGLLSEHTDYAKIKEDIEIDLWGTVVSTRVFMPLLTTGSRILMISSAFGLMGAAGYSTYCAAKAGVINFAQALRRELLCKNISVHVACPADIDTPQYAQEAGSMPGWMKQAASARKSLLSPESAAEKIINKCRGSKFLITTNFEIALFRFLGKILPDAVVAALMDASLPRPK
ncbi:MAG: SDR family NAD(P)-dependent oxidoreductase [Elusimicrobiales bacterium]|jgi:3-dehydrosphinganine reductase